MIIKQNVIMRRDPTAFRERFNRWKNGEKVYESGKALPADNTVIHRQPVIQPIKRDLIAEIQRKRAAEVIAPDLRSTYQRTQSQKAKQQANKDYQRAKDNAKRAEGLENLMKLTSPSTYIEAATGEDLGTTGRLAADAIVFGLPGIIKNAGRSIGRQALKNSTKSAFARGVNMADATTTVRLYRATGTSGTYKPSLDGTSEFTGQWFTDNINKPQIYASKAIKAAKRAGVKNPLELQYVDIPKNELSKYKASEILKGRIDIEYEPTEDYLIPLDYPRQRVPLEGYTGNLLQDARRPLPDTAISENALNSYGKEEIINPLTLDDIQYFRKLGVGGLDGAGRTVPFEEHFGLPPAEWKRHWVSIYKNAGMPEDRIEKTIQKLYDTELSHAENIYLDIQRAYSGESDSKLDVVQKAQQRILKLFKSPQYKQRLFDNGFSEETANQFIEDQISKIQTAPVLLQTNKLINPKKGGFIKQISGARGVYFPETHSIQVIQNPYFVNDYIQTIGHEMVHASDEGFGVGMAHKIYDKLVPKDKAGSLGFKYYNKDTEKRARILESLADMNDRGYNINNHNDIQEYLLLQNAFENHNVKSVFENYKTAIPDILHVYKNAFGIIPPVGIGYGAYKSNEN